MIKLHPQSVLRSPQHGHHAQTRLGDTKANARWKVFGLPRNLFWILVGATILAIVVAIVVPVSIIFGKKKAAPPHSNVLVPLYVYPDPGAWDPLYTAIEQYPNLNFTIVINPASGPGNDALPDSNYTQEIPKLNSYANFRTIGYISTAYTNRNISLALQDVTTYASWSSNATFTGLGMHGIFLDETPALYNSRSAQYLETIASAIRAKTTFGNNPYIIQNPGTVPDARYLASCDLSIVFEGSYSTYQVDVIHKSITSFIASSHFSREKMGTIVHDFPNTVLGKDEIKLLNNIRQVSGSIFLTGLKVDYYSSFSESWEDFSRDMNG